MVSWDLMTPPLLQEIFINKSFKYLDKKFIEFYDWYNDARIEIRKKWYANTHIFGFLSDLSVFYGMVQIISSFIKGLISVGSIYFQINILRSFQQNISSSFSWFNNTFEFALKLKNIYELDQAKPDFEDGTIKMEKLDYGPSIEINNLSFKYPRTDIFVLDDINIQIKPGEKIAIVGHNGAGKTTLVKLLCGMYRPTKGIILANDIDLNDLKSDTWYQNMGVLFQDFNTHSQLTVKENIIMGDPNRKVDMDEVIHAAKSADALEFIDDYPGGFDQILSERLKGGIRPSTGQWQKIAIARFFYRNAPLVIFDEPTAAIDAISEYNIFNKIYKFFKGKTVIIISHRFSTVRNADRIIVIKKGKIIEEGAHKELMDEGGYYAKSFRLQAVGYSAEEKG
jgi:ATP-binding cassette subfamily B protein